MTTTRAYRDLPGGIIALGFILIGILSLYRFIEGGAGDAAMITYMFVQSSIAVAVIGMSSTVDRGAGTVLELSARGVYGLAALTIMYGAYLAECGFMLFDPAPRLPVVRGCAAAVMLAASFLLFYSMASRRRAAREKAGI